LHRPLCNRFLLNQADPKYAHPLIFGVCRSCGLVQILLSPLNECQAIARQRGFVERGAEFKTVFPASKYAMWSA